MGASGVFLVVATPPLIAVSVVCSCKKPLRVLSLFETKKAESPITEGATSRKQKSSPTSSSPIRVGQQDHSSADLDYNTSNSITSKTPSRNGYLEKKISMKLGSDRQKVHNRQAKKTTRRQVQNKGQDINSGISSSSQRKEKLKQPNFSDGGSAGLNTLTVDGIIVFPNQLRWKVKSTVQRIHLQNSSKKRYAIKVKCTDNDLYRVQPVFTFIEPDGDVAFDVFRHGGIAKIDQILFLITSAEETDNDPRLLFTECMSNDGQVIRMVENNKIACPSLASFTPAVPFSTASQSSPLFPSPK